MPDVMFIGPEGRLEGRYHQSKEEHAPIALILHPHPQYGGTMNHKVVFSLFHVFVNRGFSVLRFNTRGVGRSQGRFDNGMGELSDAAAALDWLQTMNADAKSCWIAGYSFGAWIGMQLLMRRPEIDCFIAVAPPANSYDFGFLAPPLRPDRRRGERRSRATGRHPEAGGAVVAAEGHHGRVEDRQGRQPLLPRLARQARGRCRQVRRQVPDHPAGPRDLQQGAVSYG